MSTIILFYNKPFSCVQHQGIRISEVSEPFDTAMPLQASSDGTMSAFSRDMSLLKSIPHSEGQAELSPSHRRSKTEGDWT